MPRKKTTPQFIDDARLRHGNRYDYSLVDYQGTDVLVSIKCPIEKHGIFLQTPDKHLQGHGCHTCGGTAPITTTIFTQRAALIHHHKYDYSLANCNGSNCVVEIICPIIGHGNFFQIANLHLSGAGCPQCGGTKLKTQQQFIEQANAIHHFKYDYSKVHYINIRTKIIIICSQHGEFKQRAKNHLDGRGCDQCGGTATLTANEFVARANKIYKNKYDYSAVEYINMYTPVSISCYKHGEFSQAPDSHLRGHECPHCSKLISKKETKWLEYLGVPNNLQSRQVAIKISQEETKKHTKNVDGFDPATNTIYEFYGDYWHGNPKIYAADAFNATTKQTFGELYQNTLNREQLFKLEGYNIINIWENDFHQIIKNMNQHMIQLHLVRTRAFIKKLNLFSSALSKLFN